MEFLGHIFYTTEYLSFATKVEIINTAFTKNTKWWVDILDCNKSFSRKEIKMSFQEIMYKFNENCCFKVIHRRGYEIPFYGEIIFSTKNDPSYFLWIRLNEDDFFELIKLFQLVPK